MGICMQVIFCVDGRALQGQYKWMLYGDDDTIWFVNGVLDLARKLDPTMPYIITGRALLLLRLLGNSSKAPQHHDRVAGS